MTPSPVPSGDEQWFLRRGEDVRGPFPWTVIARHAGLGRIHPDDLLSRDRAHWRPSSELLPGLAAAQDAVVGVEQDTAGDHGAPGARGAPARTPLLAVALALTLSAALAVHFSAPRDGVAPDCHAVSGRGVNWEFCSFDAAQLSGADLERLRGRNAALRGARLDNARLVQADLAYADLAGADFTLADLSQARLVGASLRGARLNHARLTGADLSNADLRGASLAGAQLGTARLGSTLWTDGRVCPRDAVGACFVP